MARKKVSVIPDEKKPGIEFKHCPVGDLAPSPQNARTHSKAQVKKIAASIREFGFLNPVIVDGGLNVIAGHGRLEAAKLLGMDSVPCVNAQHLTDAQRRAYMLADNRIALDAGYNEEILANELRDLMAMDFDLDLTGFDDAELEKYLGDSAPADEDDDIPLATTAPITVRGDVWLLGPHRIKCGDSTDADDVASLLDAFVPHLMVTDPPYGVEYDADWRTTAKNADGSLLSTGKGRAKGVVENDNRADWREAWALFPGDVAYVWSASMFTDAVIESLEAAGFIRRAHIIWVKNNFAIGRGDYHWKHEPCWYAVKKGGKSHYNGSRKETTVWEIDKPQKSETGHSTQKPIECMRKPILNNSNPGDAVYDPFSGSFTTLIACQKENRICYGMELNPAYVDIGIIRWQELTGESAVLESTQQTYEQIKAEREGV